VSTVITGVSEKIAVLCSEDDRPPGMTEVEAGADVHYATPESLPDALRDAQVLLAWDFTSDALTRAWPAANRLAWVHSASAGVDRLLFPGLRESDVLVTNSRGVFERPIAEYVLALVLAFAKDLPTTLAGQRAGVWKHRETETVAGRRVVVVGSGPIGRETGRLLAAAGMQVRLVGRESRTGDPDFGSVHAASELVDVVSDADYVVAAAPLTEQTHGMFDERVFAAMPARARFVNIGRGPLVVEDDLVAALRSGELAGAALDVFETEPLPPEHPLWTMDQVVVSPHMAGDALGWREALTVLFADNLDRWRAGTPLRNVVDKSLGYVPGA